MTLTNPTALPATPRSSSINPVSLRQILGGVGERVDVLETARSTVFLTRDRAYRLYTDRSPFGSAHSCDRDVEANAKLAPGLALGVRAIVPDGQSGGYRLAGADHPDAIDHVVEMRRYGTASTMRGLAERGALRPSQAEAVGQRLARFHANSPAVRSGSRSVDRMAAVVAALAAVDDAYLRSTDRLAVERFALSYAEGADAILEARAIGGMLVDGHGDLRADHVVFDSGQVLFCSRPPEITDRIVDVADDLAVLLSDLEDASGSTDLGAAVLRGYESAGGTPQPASLLAFFGAVRSYQAATSALGRVAAGHADATVEHEHARRRMTLARRLAWRSRVPLVLLVTGPQTPGRSALATALGDVSGLPVMSADSIRAELGDTSCANIYRELGQRLRQIPAGIVDATFDLPELSHTFIENLGPGGRSRVLAIECDVAPTETMSRARRHALQGEPVQSENGDDRARILLDTGQPLADQVEAVEYWLDALLVAGWGS